MSLNMVSRMSAQVVCHKHKIISICLPNGHLNFLSALVVHKN